MLSNIPRIVTLALITVFRRSFAFVEDVNKVAEPL